jgi:MFS family permease
MHAESVISGKVNGGRVHNSPEIVQYEVIGGTGEGLDRSPRRNLLQLTFLIAFVVAGAVVGYYATGEAPWFAAACGGVVGLVAGTFVGGLVLLAMDRGPKRWTLEEYLTKREQAWRRERWAIIGFFANATIGSCALPFLAHNDAPWAFVAFILWIMAWVGLFACAKISAAYCSLSLRCPTCGAAVEPDAQACCPKCRCGFT